MQTYRSTYDLHKISLDGETVVEDIVIANFYDVGCALECLKQRRVYQVQRPYGNGIPRIVYELHHQGRHLFV